jgi:putative ABC transport system permease protein
VRRFFLRLANLFRGRRADGEMTREIDAHLALLQDEFERQGMPAGEARRAARRAYGGVEQAKELHREARSYVWIEQFFKDLRYSWRNLLRSPGFTLTAVVVLGIGIGVNATIFGIYNAVALKQLPIADPSHVVRLKRWFGTNEYAYHYRFAYPEYQQLRERTEAFSGLVAASSAIPALGAGSSHLNGYAVSANYFAELGVKPRIGRAFLPNEDEVAGGNAVVVLSHRFWERKLNGDSNVIGQTLALNGLPYTIIGVAPEGFTGTDASPLEPDFWTPLSMIEQLQPDFGAGWREQWRDTSHPGFQLLARLKNGVTTAEAQAEANALLLNYLSGYREPQPATTGVTLQRPSYFGNAGDFWLRALTGAVLLVVSLVLVVACANVANMLLSRGVMRQSEIGIRLALGASRARVVRQLLMESVLLSLAGGIAAIPLSAWAGRVLWISVTSALQSVRDLRTIELDVSPDAHIFLYGLALCLITGVSFGLTPALQSTRADLYSACRPEGSRLGRRRLRGILLGAQVTVSVLLLIVSGGLMSGLAGTFGKAKDLGFETHDTFSLRGSYGKGGQEKIRQIRDRLEALPEVISVARGWPPPQMLPLNTSAGKWSGDALASFASDKYFETLNIPLLRGRAFTRQEAEKGTPVAVVSQATALRFWPGQDPLGKHFEVNRTSFEVIGVAEDVRTLITEVDPTHLYLATNSLLRSGGDLVFRIGGNARDRDRALAKVESAIAAVDSNLLPALDVVSLEDGAVGILRGFLRIIAMFPAVLTLISLTLAAAGIYGVMAFLVSRRTREIGIRMALGATSGGIIQNILVQGLRPVLVGILVGIAGSVPVAALIRAKVTLLGADSTRLAARLSDPLVYIELAGVIAIAVIASIVPARRASRVDPVVALRHE